VPQYPELAMGAIATQGIVIINRSLVEELQISSSAIEATIEKEQKEIDRREKAYRGDRPSPIILDQIIILVDDGIATGATIKAAIASLHQQQPQGIIVAVPVASRSCCQDLEPLVNQLICLRKFDSLSAISRAYGDFSQTTDEEVRQFLAQKTQT
jgi:putative phosphoribosyl transferase